MRECDRPHSRPAQARGDRQQVRERFALNERTREPRADHRAKTATMLRATSNPEQQTDAEGLTALREGEG